MIVTETNKKKMKLTGKNRGIATSPMLMAGQAGCCEITSLEEIDKLIFNLKQRRIEIKDHKKGELIVKIKQFVLKFTYNYDEYNRYTLSTYLSIELSRNYTYLNNLFYKRESISINNYMIEHRIELAKELIKNGELTFKQIADKLGFSSVHHFHNQFKKIEGTSPAKWREEINK